MAKRKTLKETGLDMEDSLQKSVQLITRLKAIAMEFTQNLPSEYGHELDRLREYAEGLYARSLFKNGDRVALSATPEISDTVAWGWRGAKHFLVKDAKGNVVNVDFYKGEFRYGIVFDDETWIDPTDKTLKKHDKPSIYILCEGNLRRA